VKQDRIRKTGELRRVAGIEEKEGGGGNRREECV
jgi:hypothetical protein